ncbi:hypothetical protein O6H91_15G082200 [Diphasiastrum complanatum]|uniref:Uncharacterized protein n=1 Tax=Diphasiastrum complanatum TaxID=34168 RepID=A0ACC2BK54_DIPCM|nr:hypothetical protein O6H91_15G082200 [Diphasiastrum complanatum]
MLNLHACSHYEFRFCSLQQQQVENANALVGKHVQATTTHTNPFFLPSQNLRKKKVQYASLTQNKNHSANNGCQPQAAADEDNAILVNPLPSIKSHLPSASGKVLPSDPNATLLGHDRSSATRSSPKSPNLYSGNVNKHMSSNGLPPSPPADAFSIISRVPWDQVSFKPPPRREPPQKISLDNEHEISASLQELGRRSADDEEAEVSYHEARCNKSAMAQILEKLRIIESVGGRSKYGRSQASQSLEPGRQNSQGKVEDVTVLEAVSDSTSSISFPWEKETERGIIRLQRHPRPAELVLPESELKKLRMKGLRMTRLLKLGKEGVTDVVAKSIHEQWRLCEVVKIKCEGPAALNMKKTQQDLEQRTGGLIVWRSGSTLMFYRGKNYHFPRNKVKLSKHQELDQRGELIKFNHQEPVIHVEYMKDDGTNSESSLESKFDEELDAFMDGLGPRVEGWTREKPVPIDGDLLPAADPNFRTPLRQLQYGHRERIGNTTLTTLRRLFQPLPPQFVVGRDKGLEGLAGAIVKLWERSEMVKICVKRGVSNMKKEMIAEELKRLTGGVLIASDKSCITLHRGNDFLPPAVTEALTQREALASAFQENEEKARRLFRKNSNQDDERVQSFTAGTLRELKELSAKWDSWRTVEVEQNYRDNAVNTARLQALQSMQRKLNIANRKKQRTELELEKVGRSLAPAGAPVDREPITDEEMFMFRKIGLRMKAFLLLGRRGVFDGVVLNMHLHWKHRELVKVILKERDEAAAEVTARMLEYESGGIFICLIKISKGQAAIFYRGRNYQRPPQLRPPNLLTKRKALKRAIELQRHQSLEDDISRLERSIRKMKEKYELLGS